MILPKRSPQGRNLYLTTMIRAMAFLDFAAMLTQTLGILDIRQVGATRQGTEAASAFSVGPIRLCAIPAVLLCLLAGLFVRWGRRSWRRPRALTHSLTCVLGMIPAGTFDCE